MFVFLILDLNIVKDEIFLICDPPYDFRDKGDNTLRTHFHLKTKEIDFNMLTKHTRAHFNELVLLSHITLTKNNKACIIEQ